LEETWRKILVNPDLYLAIAPQDFLARASDCNDCKAPLNYLKKRYWENL